MPETLTDEVLCTKGFEILEDQLGPVQALRFLALVSREPFDYQRWRQEHFGKMSVLEILSQARSLSGEADQPH